MQSQLMKAVIFDMDGVLVDSEPFHVEVEKRLFKRFHLNVSDEEHRNYMGKASDVMWSEIITKKNLPWNTAEMVKLNHEESRNYFAGLYKIDPMPGVLDLLDDLKNNHIPMAVASSSDSETIELIMEKSGLIKYFRYIVSSNLVGKSKPEPDIFLYTAQLLGVCPEYCLVIEDSTNGIQAAKAANMLCIAFNGPSSDNQDQSLADMQVKDFFHLKEILNKYLEVQKTKN
ncbi:MAG: HAD family hydrolase [Bacteroidota bacterium]